MFVCSLILNIDIDIFPQIPHGVTPSIDNNFYYQLSVNGTGGAEFSELRYIRFMEKGFTIYIQTDKAIYKPGQNGKNWMGYGKFWIPTRKKIAVQCKILLVSGRRESCIYSSFYR